MKSLFAGALRSGSDGTRTRDLRQRHAGRRAAGLSGDRRGLPTRAGLIGLTLRGSAGAGGASSVLVRDERGMLVVKSSNRHAPDYGLDGPAVVLISGGSKAIAQAMDDRVYREARRQRDEYLASSPRRVLRDG